VVAVVFEDMDFGQGDVTGTDWTDIVQLAAGGTLTVGVRKNGTVVATGNNEYGQLDVTGWTDIVCVGAGLDHALGVKSDGSVVAAGRNDYGQCDVTGWMLQTP
jgi:alpha-tubulin suppressor-like RCC1 family protein